MLVGGLLGSPGSALLLEGLRCTSGAYGARTFVKTVS